MGLSFAWRNGCILPVCDHNCVKYSFGFIHNASCGLSSQKPNTYIKEHILKGDTSDGIPNVLSPDHTFTDGLRQIPLSKKKIEAWVESETDMNDEVKRNFQRNQKLIDLSNTPFNLEEEILLQFDQAPCGDRSKLLNYFIHNRLKELTESIGDF